ncbi:MAG: hypothetical protein ACI35P_13235 [Bacillus sp. (in: firmicutes)]
MGYRSRWLYEQPFSASVNRMIDYVDEQGEFISVTYEEEQKRCVLPGMFRLYCLPWNCIKDSWQRGNRIEEG